MDKWYEWQEIGHILVENLIVSNQTTPDALVLSESDMAEGKYIIVIDAIHAGMTRNFVDYTKKALKEALPTWVKPVPKPLLKDHAEKADNVMGRVLKAQFIGGKTARVRLTVQVYDAEAIEKIKDMRYLGVSIGSSVNIAECSVCGKNVVESYCGHWKGNKYNKDGEVSEKGEQCRWIVRDLTHREVSVVAVPADEQARIISVQTESNSEELDGSLKFINTGAGGELMKIQEQDVDAIEAEVTADINMTNNAPTSEEEKQEEKEQSLPITENDNEEIITEEEAQSNELPDSAYALIKEGENIIRALPYMTSEGEIDKDALTSALEDIKTLEGFSQSDKRRAFAKLKLEAMKAGIEISNESMQIEAPNAKVTELRKKVKELESENELLKMEVQELALAVDQYEEIVTYSTNESTDLLDEIAMLNEQIHCEKLERLADIKLLNNIEKNKSREEIIESYKDKTIEAISLLIDEFSTLDTLEAPPKIHNETLPMGQTGEQEDKTDIVHHDKDTTCATLETLSASMIRRAIQGDKEAQEYLEQWEKQLNIGGNK